jgi:hypothetical protein
MKIDRILILILFASPKRQTISQSGFKPSHAQRWSSVIYVPLYPSR